MRLSIWINLDGVLPAILLKLSAGIFDVGNHFNLSFAFAKALQEACMQTRQTKLVAGRVLRQVKEVSVREEAGTRREAETPNEGKGKQACCRLDLRISTALVSGLPCICAVKTCPLGKI